MKYIMKIYILIFCLTLFNLPIFGAEITNTSQPIIEVNYFGTDSCSSCLEINSYLKDFQTRFKDSFLDSNSNKVDFKINTYKTENPQDKIMLEKMNLAYEVPEEIFLKVPAVFVGDKYFIGVEDIQENLYRTISDYSKDLSTYKTPSVDNLENALEKSKDEVFNSKFKKINALGIFATGFLDGINPCAIAMLLFFFTFLTSCNKKAKDILLVGGSFILATFLTYLLIGLGLFKFTAIFSNAKPIMVTIYSVTIGLSIFLAIQSFLDFSNVKGGKYENVKLQLPQKLKHTIHNFIRKANNNKFLVLSAFISGVVVSCLEFFCTGQVYLPTIMYMIDLYSSSEAFLYLLLYNFAFTIPLIVVCISLSIGKEVISVSSFFVEKLHWIKFASMIFFLIISILMIDKLMSIL